MRPANIIEINAISGEPRINRDTGGWSFSRTTSDGASLEVLILDQNFLIYEAAYYEGWTAFRARYDQISNDLRARIHEAVNVRAVALG